jgi:hypothetical protein
MNYPSIRIEGAILSPDILDRLEDAPGQRPADFGLESTARVKDEIARAWADAQDYWRIFQRRLETLRADSPATTETRQQWIVPLLGLLGYQLEYQPRGVELNGKLYAISHRVTNRGNIPLHIIGYREPAGLDRKPERVALRMSAHAMVQEYLNLQDERYGLVTNGRVLRLLRDTSRLVKLTYLEFDLDRMFTDGLFADFAVFYRLLHASRLPQTVDTASSCWLERYHQDSLEQGTRIREGLRLAVTEALEILGTGFLAHHDNAALRQQATQHELRPDAYFNYLLRLVYRLLFLMVTEERGLVFASATPRQTLQIYYDHYSVQRLRRLAVTRGLKVERFYDAWLSLLTTFRLFEHPETAAKLGATALGGQLFHPQALGPLCHCRLSNAAFFAALERLCYFTHPQSGQRLPVNFGALATEEFGSVYESLLELHPFIDTIPGPRFGFRQAVGNERKTSGSYYTPASLVDCLLDSALDPVLEERISNYRTLGYPDAASAVLALKVCDPACGSGHFLIAAAQRIARRLATLRAGGEEPEPEVLRHSLRDVIGHCIYGVDISPMAVELCKVGLWLEAVEPGKPLTFLDHHIKCGNSLLGATPAAIREGIPDKAYEPIIGDTKEAARWMRKLNQEARSGQGHFDFAQAMPWERLGNLPAAMAGLETLDDDTPEALARKEMRYREIVEGSGYESARLLHDTWCAAFVWPKQAIQYGTELTTEHLRKIERNPHSVSPHLKEQVRALARQYRFFHWHIEFPAVFGAEGDGGFEVVLGNPPWERVKVQEKEFFAERHAEIANAPNAAARKRLIAELATRNPALLAEFHTAQRQAEGESHLMRNSGLYPLCGRGDINTYAVFAERGRLCLCPTGRMGLVLPSGIATDDTTKFYFQNVVETNALVSLFDFENKGIFPGVHSSYKFCLFTAGSGRGLPAGRKVGDVAEFVFFAHAVEDLEDSERRFTLSAEDIALLNPNTRTCPIFRSRKDAELTRVIYRRVPILAADGDFHSPNISASKWSIRLFTMLHSSGAAHLFRDAKSLPEDLQRLGNRWSNGSLEFVPLYEGKMFHQFDHRFASVIMTENLARPAQPVDASMQDHEKPEWVPTPRAWVAASAVDSSSPEGICTCLVFGV